MLLGKAFTLHAARFKTPDTQWFVRQIDDGKLVYVNKEKAFHGTGHQGRLPLWDHALRNALSDFSIKTEDDLVKEKSAQPTRYSVQPDEIEKQDKSFVERMNEKLAAKLEKGNPQIKVNNQQADTSFGPFTLHAARFKTLMLKVNIVPNIRIYITCC